MNDASEHGGRVARKIRLRAFLFLFLALAMGGAAIFLVRVYVERAQAAAGPGSGNTMPVVVAAMDLPIAQVLDERHLQVLPWPKDAVPEGSFNRPEDVIGRSVRQRIVKGEALLGERLAEEGRGRGLAAILQEGTRAMAVKVDQVIGIGGFVQPGDYVDVLATMAPDDEVKKALKTEPAKISKIILQNVRVLAAGEHLDSDGRKPVKVQVVTLEVSPEQSERLALASQHGKIQLTMRSRIDQELRPTVGIAPLDLLTPDPEGAENLFARTSPAVAQQETPRSDRHASTRRLRRTSRSEPQVATKEETEVAPVVEILRGTRKVEERKLRKSPDSE